MDSQTATAPWLQAACSTSSSHGWRFLSSSTLLRSQRVSWPRGAEHAWLQHQVSDINAEDLKAVRIIPCPSCLTFPIASETQLWNQAHLWPMLEASHSSFRVRLHESAWGITQDHARHQPPLRPGTRLSRVFRGSARWTMLTSAARPWPTNPAWHGTACELDLCCDWPHLLLVLFLLGDFALFRGLGLGLAKNFHAGTRHAAVFRTDWWLWSCLFLSLRLGFSGHSIIRHLSQRIFPLDSSLWESLHKLRFLPNTTV